ncbi:MAG: hypothetical protein QOF89_5942 [Acidobacteriota bacterium]|jgi:hypothetical protein|nr:hypothetical protein [Acidobacteriota bacterium]
MKRAFVCALTLALLAAALPAAAATVRTIENGIDVWHTPGDGTSYVDFARNPIPKGFFCTKSAAFTGRIALRGRPLTTGTPGELGGADTIVQRLDDATFDGSGVATTRIQLRALQLESVAPVKTTCGDFHVQVSLSGTQPTTKMRIIRETESSGRFEAPIEVRYRVSFFPTKGAPTQRLDLVRSFTLAPAPNATWGAIETKQFASRANTLLVDTDGDQIPDTFLPKTSGNFQAGWTPALERAMQIRRMQKALDGTAYACSYSDEPECHPEAQGIHCAEPCGAIYAQ